VAVLIACVTPLLSSSILQSGTGAFADDLMPSPYFIDQTMSPDDNCIADTLVSTNYLTPDGVLHSSPTSGAGEVRAYIDLSGLEYTITYPPNDFQPLDATAAELELYGFPPRPTSNPALSAWNADYTDFEGIYVAAPCTQVNQSNDDPLSQSSSYWSGRLDAGGAHGGSYKEVTAKIPVPTYHNCGVGPHSASHWVGLTNNDSGDSFRLTQNGLAAIQGTLDGVNVWWEQISGDSDSHQKNVGQDLNPGDVIRATTWHNTSKTMRYSWVQTHVVAGGEHRSWGTVTVDGNNSYSGDAAVFINERNVVDGHHYPLRDFGTETLSSQYVFWGGSSPGEDFAGTQPNTLEYMTSDGTSTGHRLTKQANVVIDSVDTIWVRCS
jgi:hypothetical protein